MAAHQTGEVTPEVVSRAFSACPTNVDVTASHLYYQAPRWGGSYAKMEAAIRAASARGVSEARLVRLRNVVRLDKASAMELAGQQEEAFKFLNDAIVAEPTAALFRQRARLYWHQQDPPHALADANEAVLRSKGGWDMGASNLTDLLVIRTWALHMLGRADEARSDLEAAMVISPRDEQVQRWAGILGLAQP